MQIDRSADVACSRFQMHTSSIDAGGLSGDGHDRVFRVALHEMQLMAQNHQGLLVRLERLRLRATNFATIENYVGDLRSPAGIARQNSLHQQLVARNVESLFRPGRLRRRLRSWLSRGD